MEQKIGIEACLPEDHHQAVLVGRIWQPEVGPTLVKVQQDGVYDLSSIAATSSQLFEMHDAVEAVRSAAGLLRLGSLDAVLANSIAIKRDEMLPWLLAPCDLQADQPDRRHARCAWIERA